MRHVDAARYSRVFTYDHLNSPYFDDVAAKLTDGQSGTLQTTFYNVVGPLAMGVGVGYEGSERALLGLPGATDLAGHTISSIQLDVLSSDLSQMTFKGSTIDVDTFHIRWTIFGDDQPNPVPEPASLVLLLSGGVTAVIARRRRSLRSE